MKANIIILFILLLTVSLGNAQSVKEENKVVEATEIIVVESNDDTKSEEIIIIEEESDLIDNVEFEAILARSTSDIRIYLNRERNISNIGLLFPTIEKRVKA
jgi:hypothetical protein